MLPGSYDIGILEGMDALQGTPPSKYILLNSLYDLPFLGADRAIAANKRFGFTTMSRGILVDVRNGGLKRDLTIAFENDRVFRQVFPSSDPERYLVITPERLASARDLKTNGYIHWDIFKDYYNLKKYIRRIGRGDALDIIAFTKDGLFNKQDNPFYTGQLGPHQMGRRNPTTHRGHPYGNFEVYDDRRQTDNYKHSPIMPILSRMQQNAWVDLSAAQSGRNKWELVTHVQLWTSHYNPYNISMRVLGDESLAGPRVINYPQVNFTVSGFLNDEKGLGNKRQSHVPYQVVLGPGRSHVFGFKKHGRRGTEVDRGLYSDAVKDLTLESVYNKRELSRPISGRVTLGIDFMMDSPTLMHGADERNGPREVSQVFFSPVAWDMIYDDRNQPRPGKAFTKTVDASELNENSMVSMSLALRTTNEEGYALRPLMDANIRAVWNNPKWDSPLGLPTLAAYSTDGEAPEQFIPMSTEDPPRGYTYWGAGRDPVDGFDRVILFDVPREDLVSLGQLQHAGAGRFSYEPSYIVGNSYANPRIPAADWKAAVPDTFSTRARGLAQWKIRGRFDLYDASYLVNERLWDSFIFTTIPQVRDNHTRGEPRADFATLLAGTALLPNPRFIPYEPAGSGFDRKTLQDAGNSRGTTGSFFHNAGHLLVDGAFNINSSRATSCKPSRPT